MLYHRKKPRASWYDYTSPWCYFITICTHDREHYFWKIVDGSMTLEQRGMICEKELDNMLQKRPSVDIHKYIIMPNHVHLLMVIDDRRDMGLPCPVNNNSYHKNNKDDASVRPYNPPSVITNQSLWSIIGWWKSATSKRCHEQWLAFGRQSRYHDHIVRNEWEYERIKYYIQNNPKNREEDTFYQ